jgi:hypothetical protein
MQPEKTKAEQRADEDEHHVEEVVEEKTKQTRADDKAEAGGDKRMRTQLGYRSQQRDKARQEGRNEMEIQMKDKMEAAEKVAAAKTKYVEKLFKKVRMFAGQAYRRQAEETAMWRNRAETAERTLEAKRRRTAEEVLGQSPPRQSRQGCYTRQDFSLSP